MPRPFLFLISVLQAGKSGVLKTVQSIQVAWARNRRSLHLDFASVWDFRGSEDRVCQRPYNQRLSAERGNKMRTTVIC